MLENIQDEIPFEQDIEPEEDDDSTNIPRNVRKLRTQPYDKSIADLIRMIDEDEIVLRPDFQRNSVWDNKRASKLIESIWLSIPIPQIFVSVEEDGKWNVIDGQQRLTSLRRFYKNEFQLKGMDVLHELNGSKYDTLEDKPKRLLNGGNIRIVAIHEDSHPDIKFDVFMRINQGAVQLNAQELRNCLYRGNLNNLLHELSNNKDFLSILNLREPHKRFNDVEIILRYFSISDSSSRNFDDYPGTMKKFLNAFMRKNRESNNDNNKQLEKKFNENILKAKEIFGNNAFRKWITSENKFETSLNLSLMDCQMLAIEEWPIEIIRKHKDNLLESFKKIFEPTEIESKKTENDIFIDSITKGTSSKAKLIHRVHLIKQKFKEIIEK